MAMPYPCLSRRAVVAGAALAFGIALPPSLRAQQQPPPQQPPQAMTLQQAIEMSQRQGLQSRAATASRDAARFRDRAFNGRLLPQVSLGATLPEYGREMTAVVQPDGSTIFRPLQQTRQSLAMTVSQKLPFTGGDFFVQSRLQKLEVSGQGERLPWSSTPLTVGIEQQIFRPNTVRWESREQDIEYTLAGSGVGRFQNQRGQARLVTQAGFHGAAAVSKDGGNGWIGLRFLKQGGNVGARLRRGLAVRKRRGAEREQKRERPAAHHPLKPPATAEKGRISMRRQSLASR